MFTAVSDKTPATGRKGAVLIDRPRLDVIALAACTLALWMLLQGYNGVIHDARLYSMQALAHLHPDLLGQDLYLRFGSQDRYTVFSPLYSVAISLFGLEAAAALLTVLSHAAFFAAAACLARQLLPARQALLSVALLVVVPSEYGPGSLFQFIEGFITPRLAAEALVLAGLAAFFARRHLFAAAFMLGALLMHPLMGIAGVVLVLALNVALPRPRVALASVVAVALLLSLASFAVPALRVDDAWHAIIANRMPQVSLTQWSLESWARALVPLNALAIAVIVLPKTLLARQVSFAAILMGLCGLALTLFGADLLRVTLVTQGQPWRWLWLANALAIILLPLIITSLWERGWAGRATLALLVSLWLLRNDAYCLVLMPFVIASALFSMRAKPTAAVAADQTAASAPASAARGLFLGSLTMLALALVWSVANNVLFAGVIYDAFGGNVVVEKLRGISDDGLLPVAALVGAWASIRYARSHAACVAMTAIATIACLALLPIKITEWTSTSYPPVVRDEFAAWRARIPAGSEVLWMGTPIDGWVLLQRPLYLAVDQAGSVLFSREAAMELQRRDSLLAKFLPEAHFLPATVDRQPGTATTLASACQLPELTFIATRMNLRGPELERASQATPRFNGLRLYRCDRTEG